MIEYFHEMKKPLIIITRTDIVITCSWLAGFVDGDATFSTSKNVPRFKLENHHKEKALFLEIKHFFNDVGTLYVTQPRKNRIDSNQMIVLEYNQISFLKNKIIPTFYALDGKPLLQSKKLQDFFRWSAIVNLYFFGYHLLAEGLSLIFEIKKNMNQCSIDKKIVSQMHYSNEMKEKVLAVFTLPHLMKYVTGLYLKNTQLLISEKHNLIVVNRLGESLYFKSLSECSKKLKIGKVTIKKYLLTGNFYKDYKFLNEPSI